MALNEAAGRSRGNLTPQQKREAEAAIYGLQDQTMNQQFSHEEIERMRQIVAAHTDSRTENQSFDLNRPPQKPYTHQEFPKIVYHHGKRIHKTVNGPEQLSLAEASGFVREPFPVEVDKSDPEFDEETAAEVARVNAAAKRKSKG